MAVSLKRMMATVRLKRVDKSLGIQASSHKKDAKEVTDHIEATTTMRIRSKKTRTMPAEAYDLDSFRGQEITAKISANKKNIFIGDNRPDTQSMDPALVGETKQILETYRTANGVKCLHFKYTLLNTGATFTNQKEFVNAINEYVK